MSVLSDDARVRVVSQLVEGCSVASTVRLTNVSKPTVLSLLVRVGDGCDRLHNRLVRDLECVHVEIDEIWSFIQKKQARVTASDPADYGDVYTFVAMSSGSRLVISYLAGKRDEASTVAFIGDLRARLVTVPQLATDGWRPYPVAIGQHFAASGVDYCVIHKDYSRKPQRDDQVRYEPPRGAFVTKIPTFGAPDLAKATTSRVEKQNHTMRMSIRRMTRLSNGFSRKLANHRAAVALHFAYYNFCRVHEALRVTPAMEAGIADRIWTVEDLVAAALSEPAGAAPEAKPLRLPEAPAGAPAPSARQTSGGTWLRLVSSRRAPGGAGAPPPPPEAAPPGRETRQLGLFDARPEPPKPRRPMEQLSLFDAE